MFYSIYIWTSSHAFKFPPERDQMYYCNIDLIKDHQFLSLIIFIVVIIMMYSTILVLFNLYYNNTIIAIIIAIIRNHNNKNFVTNV